MNVPFIGDRCETLCYILKIIVIIIGRMMLYVCLRSEFFSFYTEIYLNATQCSIQFRHLWR